jgi:cytochrome oxidase Cu insertion factor (SCO1/SenC/PrrC family)
MTSKTGSKVQLISLISLFLIPLIGAWFIFYNPEYLPSGRSNKGTLISPVIALESFQFIDENNTTINSQDAYKDYWTMVLFAGDNCDSICRQRIHDMHQIRKALQADYQRVKRLVLVETDIVNTNLKGYVQGYQGTDLMSQNRDLVVKLKGLISIDKQDIVNNVFILDPMQNIMMNYGLQHSDEDILHDMTKLLKINQWGSGH